MRWWYSDERSCLPDLGGFEPLLGILLSRSVPECASECAQQSIVSLGQECRVVLAALAVWRAYPGASIWGVARRLKWGASEDDAQFYAECLVNTPPPRRHLAEKHAGEMLSVARARPTPF